MPCHSFLRPNDKKSRFQFHRIRRSRQGRYLCLRPLIRPVNKKIKILFSKRQTAPL